MEFLRFEDHTLVPWKNGAGVTREVAVGTGDAMHPGFLWRVSIATVDRPGPFSRFDGIDRSIAVLEGEGLLLSAGEGHVAVTLGGEPYAFAGETPVEAGLIGGATRDLNAMTRRGVFTHTMQRLTFRHAAFVEGDGDETIVIFATAVSAAMPDGRHAGRPLDGVRGLGRGERLHLSAEGEAQVFVIRFSAVRDRDAAA